MVLGSHNSWSYLPVRKWWMKPIAWIARCQNVDIRTQYELGVRCFDLRVRFDNDGNIIVAHGIIEYKDAHIFPTLMWLNSKRDCYVRVLHEVRSKKQHTEYGIERFIKFCFTIEYSFKNIHFWCGRNLYDWNRDYDFNEYYSCKEDYGSVSTGKRIYSWWPWLYARLNNRRTIEKGTGDHILLIDYVNIK